MCGEGGGCEAVKCGSVVYGMDCVWSVTTDCSHRQW